MIACGISAGLAVAELAARAGQKGRCRAPGESADKAQVRAPWSPGYLAVEAAKNADAADALAIAIAAANGVMPAGLEPAKKASA